MTEYPAALDALALTWQEWARIGRELADHEWERPTRCVPWRVVDVYAHHSVFPRALIDLASATPAEGTPVTAVDVLRRFNAPGGIAHERAAHVADYAITEAGQRSHAELVDRFAVSGPRAIDALRAAGPQLPVPWAIHVVPLSEALRIALMEAGVHLLDVQRALDRPPAVPEVALRDTAVLFAEMAPAVEFVESASGRAAAAPPLPVRR